jgi:hypothetical protein
MWEAMSAIAAMIASATAVGTIVIQWSEHRKRSYEPTSGAPALPSAPQRESIQDAEQPGSAGVSTKP